MEYMRAHNFKLAEQFFMQSKSICPSDPLVYNELGVVAYSTKEYKKAAWWFEKTLALISTAITETWEPTFVNFAHTLRKLKRYDEAISCYEKALALSTTRILAAFAGLAYTYHLQGDFSAAIEYYHKALWLKPTDEFCTELLTLALVDGSRDFVDFTPDTSPLQEDSCYLLLLYHCRSTLYLTSTGKLLHSWRFPFVIMSHLLSIFKLLKLLQNVCPPTMMLVHSLLASKAIVNQ